MDSNTEQNTMAETHNMGHLTPKTADKLFASSSSPISVSGQPISCSDGEGIIRYSSVSVDDNSVLNSSGVSQTQNESTERKTKSCLKRILLFFKEHGESRPPECLSPPELDQMIAFFFKETKRLDGEDFQPISLKSFQNSLDRYLRNKNYPYSVLNDSVFSLSRNVLWARKKELKEQGKVVKPITVETLTPAEEQQLWEKGFLGNMNDPWSLQRTVWFFNQKAMRFKGSSDAYQLKWGDVQLRSVDQRSGETRRIEYLQINKRIIKQKLSSTVINQRPRTRILPNLSEPLRCPIRFFKAFTKKRPCGMLQLDSPFYLAVRNKRYDNPAFYKSCKLGIHALERILKTPIETIRKSGKFQRLTITVSARFIMFDFGFIIQSPVKVDNFITWAAVLEEFFF